MDEALRYVQSGCRVVVDMDLEKFFDRVHHDILMARLARRIDDKAVLRLIFRYLEADGQSAALFIDQLIGQHQVVIKSLEANYRRVPGIAGATIMGDGRVALILDVPVLVDMARRVLPAAA